MRDIVSVEHAYINQQTNIDYLTYLGIQVNGVESHHLTRRYQKLPVGEYGGLS